MNEQINYNFGYALAAQRRAEFEAAARHDALVRVLKKDRREARRRDGADAARPRIARQRGAAQCASDIG
jgi:hypothetical protein